MGKRKAKSETTKEEDKVLSPKQIKFLEYYLDMKSETYSNALQSALRAGYNQEYSENITYLMPKWLSESIGDMTRLRKAERIFDKTLDMEAVSDEGVVDNQLLKTQVDVAKFVGGTLGKIKYSNKGEDSVSKLAEAITGMHIAKDNGDNIQDTKRQTT